MSLERKGVAMTKGWTGVKTPFGKGGGGRKEGRKGGRRSLNFSSFLLLSLQSGALLFAPSTGRRRKGGREGGSREATAVGDASVDRQSSRSLPQKREEQFSHAPGIRVHIAAGDSRLGGDYRILSNRGQQNSAEKNKRTNYNARK